jgi:hypothetical protein
MTRVSLKLALALLAPMAALGQVASPFTFYVHDTTGVLPDTPLPATYQLAETAVGNASPTVLKMVNSSQDTVYFIIALVSTSATTPAANPNFSATGIFQDETLAPGGDVLFNVNFTPSTVGPITGYLDVAFQIQENGCIFTSSNPSQQCPSALVNVSTLTGTGSPAMLVLSYQSTTGSVVLQPSGSSPLTFPNTSLSATSTYTFTLSNPSSVDEPAPAISLPTINTNAPSGFTLDTSGVPATIAAGQSANFNVTFAPGQTGLANGLLQIGSNSCTAPLSTAPLSSCFPIAGEGIIVATVDSLQISYTDATGIRTSPQAATPISFPQVVPGSGASAVLAFNVTNPATADGPISISSISVSGAAFSLASVPTAPIVIALGASISFNLIFQPTSSGTFTGSLSIGGRQFSLTALSVASPLPGFNLTLASPISSQQQASLTVNFSSPSSVAAIGTITLQFTPSVATVTDDPAITFIATAGRELNIDVAAGSQTAAYNGEPGILFQTGTTGGTVTFTVAFPDTATYTQSFTIPATTVQITSVQANRESPNLLVTVSGYDNTYSAGELSFTFLDTAGKAIGSPIQSNAAASFQGLYFTGNTSGGLFSLQANFPVTGDVTQVGSVTVGVTNSLGQSTASATFQ